MSIRCQLPTEDLDALVSIKSDEDLINLLEEYNQLTLLTSSSTMKIRAFLSPIYASSKSTTTRVSSSSSSSSLKSISPKSLSPSSSFSGVNGASSPRTFMQQQQQATVVAYPAALCYAMKSASSRKCLNCCRNSSQFYLVHNGKHWQ